MPDNSKGTPHIYLLGDLEENFYQLGQKDSENIEESMEHIRALLKSPWKLLNQSIEKIVESFIKAIRPKHLENQIIKSYSEGLNKDPSEIFLSLLYPEIISFMSKWIPNLPQIGLGCSSFFALNDEDQVVHYRVLDFPLIGSYDQFERAVTMELDGRPKVFHYSSAGLPYAGLTCMNEHGLTIAVHQKFNDHFYHLGTPIFELVNEIIFNCDTTESVLEFLKDKSSITAWGLYISDKNKNVLTIDIVGKEHRYQKFTLEKGEVLYFNNFMIGKEDEQKNYLPSGIYHYNKMREKSAEDKIKKIISSEKFDDLDVLKKIATFKNENKKTAKNYNLDLITPSSLQVVSMNPTKGISYSIAGKAPKLYTGLIDQFSDVWDGKAKYKLLKNKAPKKSETTRDALNDLMLSQRAFDLGLHDEIYHHIQLAMFDLQGSPLEYIAKFYFLAFQFIEESHDTVLSQIYSELYDLKDLLPVYLKDNCLLYIFRIEKILGKKSTVSASDFEEEAVLKLYKIEKSIPKTFYGKLVKNLSFPRLEVLDLIHPYGK